MLGTLAALTLAVACALPGMAHAETRVVSSLPGGIRPLSLEVVDSVIERNDALVQSCARSRVRDTLAVLLDLEIDADGRVSGAEAIASSAEARCLERVARRLRFPASGTVTRVAFPFLLAPRR